MTATEVAARASITRETLRHIEQGTGAARIDSLFAVLQALGVTDAVLRGVNPYNNDSARARIDDIITAGGEL